MMQFKNVFGATNSGVDQQRADLFKVSISLPPAIAGGTGASVWDKEIGWAVEKFPFPDRGVEVIPIKYLQQTNFQIGGDKPTPEVTITTRYAFQRRTAVLLEQWKELMSNPNSGGVGLTSQVKTTGYFYWLMPNPSIEGIENPGSNNSYILNRAYFLEGVLLTSLKPSDQDMTSGTGVVTYDVGIQVDRYYPVSTTDLQSLTIPSLSVGANVSAGVNVGGISAGVNITGGITI